MLAVGGLKAAAKRTVFGDVSNTAKSMSSAHDDSVITAKAINLEIVKPLAVQETSAAFLRPAQRPLNVAAKGAINNNSMSHFESVIQTKAPLAESRQPQATLQPVNKRTLSNRGTTIYKDTADSEQQVQAPKQDCAPTVPVHQTLGPRHIKSQPQLKQDAPIPRRTQSKYIGTELSEKSVPSDPADQDAAEAHILDSSIIAYESAIAQTSEKLEEAQQEGVKLGHDAFERQHRQLPNPPLVSEPEEYWEEEEEEVYDEQGYTTAHSYRSRGDNTTGGATTVLFPKVTNKAKKELAAAKELVESARSAEDIEDELWDTSMVAEYGDEIFAYMRELEVRLRAFIQSLNSLVHWLLLTRPNGRLCRLPCDR
jgi:G2/mitotic-specific cyclin 3/4